jgi:transposase
MTRRKKDPLREMTKEEREWLERMSRSMSEPATHVARAKEILAVADGHNYTEAAIKAGRKSGDAVSQLVGQYNKEGVKAIQPRHGGGPQAKYGAAERERVLAEVGREPDAEKDGAKTWSLKLLERALRKAPDGLPEIGSETIREILLESGYSWQQSRSWCKTGQAVRKRKGKKVIVVDPDAIPKKLD